MIRKSKISQFDVHIIADVICECVCLQIFLISNFMEEAKNHYVIW